MSTVDVVSDAHVVTAGSTGDVDYDLRRIGIFSGCSSCKLQQPMLLVHCTAACMLSAVELVQGSTEMRTSSCGC